MAELSDFLSLVRGKMPGCPELLMEEAVRESAIDFCKRTKLLINEVKIRVVVGLRFYEMYPPDGITYTVNSVRRDNDDFLNPSSRHDFECEKLDVDSGQPTDYYIEGDGRLVLGPIPDAIETLTAGVTIRPDDTATVLPDALYSEWRTAIAAGARAFIRQNYFEWTNDQEEAKDRVFFDSEVNRANLLRAKGASKKALRVRGHYF